MNIRFDSIDIGNDALKGFFNGLNAENKVYIPNIIAEVEERTIVEYEKKILNGLHVEITSSALQTKGGKYVVGELATKFDDNNELTHESDKYNNDQSVILLLTAVAYDAALNIQSTENTVDVSVYLSTGLPLSEIKHKKDFRKKLKNSTHEVKFLQTPKLEGITVNITFNEVLVNPEGFSAYVDLMMNQDGSERNVELQGKDIMINDIGGLSTDTAIIMSDGSIDNTNSKGIQEGVSPYLDKIIEQVENEYKYTFKSRKELVDILTGIVPEDKNHIYVKSNRTSIENFIKPILHKLAVAEYKHLSRVWEQVPSIRTAYLIGGGALILKDYINAINEEKHKFALRYIDNADDSIWMIARAYFKILSTWCATKGIEMPTEKVKVTNE
ncbi:ParM/StbA family protein [Bacillus tropicus]|uniref:ParM/StbA family protein n=1 Tax=Bacillus cereus group TaxID=86661 RepID=UPI0021CE6BF0|nr:MULTISPECIES: ParM/StbA family protein [Bacillus cereus group]MCU5425782.1 ParM/StbA family protein [Bacillus tropicus]MDA1898895.1 ParM/StbA family protein [Bacillus cereus group sp. BcHK28]